MFPDYPSVSLNLVLFAPSTRCFAEVGLTAKTERQIFRAIGHEYALRMACYFSQGLRGVERAKHPSACENRFPCVTSPRGRRLSRARACVLLAVLSLIGLESQASRRLPWLCMLFTGASVRLWHPGRERKKTGWRPEKATGLFALPFRGWNYRRFWYHLGSFIWICPQLQLRGCLLGYT